MIKKTPPTARFLALWLTFSLTLPSPALGLREIQTKNSGVEEQELSEALLNRPTAAGAEERQSKEFEVMLPYRMHVMPSSFLMDRVVALEQVSKNRLRVELGNKGTFYSFVRLTKALDITGLSLDLGDTAVVRTKGVLPEDKLNEAAGLIARIIRRIGELEQYGWDSTDQLVAANNLANEFNTAVAQFARELPAAGAEAKNFNGGSWYDAHVDGQIPVNVMVRNLRSIRDALLASAREGRTVMLPGDLEDFSDRYLLQWSEATHRFNELLNEPMTASRFEEELKALQVTMMGKDLLGLFGKYDIGIDLSEVQGFLQDIFSEEMTQKLKGDPVHEAAAAFIRFIELHPFFDGNHRAGSFLMNYMLLKSGYIPFLLTPENFVDYVKITVPRRVENRLERFETFLNLQVKLDDNQYGFERPAAGAEQVDSAKEKKQGEVMPLAELSETDSGQLSRFLNDNGGRGIYAGPYYRVLKALKLPLLQKAISPEQEGTPQGGRAVLENVQPVLEQWADKQKRTIETLALGRTEPFDLQPYYGEAPLALLAREAGYPKGLVFVVPPALLDAVVLPGRQLTIFVEDKEDWRERVEASLGEGVNARLIRFEYQDPSKADIIIAEKGAIPLLPRQIFIGVNDQTIRRVTLGLLEQLNQKGLLKAGSAVMLYSSPQGSVLIFA